MKSGLAYIGDTHLVVNEELSRHAHFRGFNLVRVNATESYAANCLRINDRVLVTAGFPGLRDSLERLGQPVLSLEVSEFEKNGRRLELPFTEILKSPGVLPRLA